MASVLAFVSHNLSQTYLAQAVDCVCNFSSWVALAIFSTFLLIVDDVSNNNSYDKYPHTESQSFHVSLLIACGIQIAFNVIEWLLSVLEFIVKHISVE